MPKLPYVTTPGKITVALDAIKSAAVPPKITQDFVKTKLNIQGSTGDQITSFLKKINFATSDGTPTDLYRKSRNSVTSGYAIAEAVRAGYSELYTYNEYAHDLSEDELKALIIQITGAEPSSSVVRQTTSCFRALADLADFDYNTSERGFDQFELSQNIAPQNSSNGNNKEVGVQASLGLNLGYTINLNLPATSDSAVFNAIFKSLKEHLLSDDNV